MARIDWDKLNRESERRRAALSREHLKRIMAVLRNERGIKRLLSISDEEWQAAVDADAGEESG
jgi:Mn-dependent DtxR family transcriptional regulator